MKRPLTAEDALALRVVADAQITPDGSRIAFVVRDPFKVDTKFPKSQVWVAPAVGGEAIPFTSGPRSDAAPRWSPDSRSLAFVSDRKEDGKHQLYLWRDGAGEAQALTDLGGSVHSPAWSPDGTHLAFLMEDPATEEEKKRKENKDDAIEFEKHPKFTRLWTVKVATGETREVTKGAVQIWEFDWSPDGQRFALVASDWPFEYAWYEPYLAVVQAEGGELQRLYSPHETRGASEGHRKPPSGAQLARPLWSPDGRQISFISATWSDRGVVGGDVYVIPAEGGAPRNLTEGQPVSVSWTAWRADSAGLFVAAYEDGEQALGVVACHPPALRLFWRDRVAFAERHQPRFSHARDGSIAVIREDTKHPRDVWLIPHPRGPEIEWRQLTRLNPLVEDFTLAEYESLHWRGRDGLDIQGQLARPADAEPGRRLPLVVLVHGGPTALHAYHFNGGAGNWPLPELLAARGMAVLLPNPRGSTGWGRTFAQANLGDMGGEDCYDILGGVDHCIQQGIADATRLGILGWSYGGFMTAWMVTQTDRFRAGVMGAGIANWRSFHGTSNLPTWDALYYQADPYQVGSRYDHFSPLTHAARARTPTLIVHGEADTYVPVGQAYEFYRALREHGCTVELVVYPREGHGVEEKQHQLELSRRIVEWFERWLG